ncbi:MAG: DUF1294 domain-containing protein [Clostridium sp.]|nr:DUF1294 domain-containing protein [Clostridium sp.]
MERSVFIIPLLAVNLAAFLLFGLDKWKAKNHRWRVPERTLLLFAAAGGSAGALLGMYLFHHKTNKPKFYLGVPAILALQVLLLYLGRNLLT